MEMKVDLTDKVAIVTGAAQGIGECAARGLVDDGTRVLAVDILDMPEDADKKWGERCRFLHNRADDQGQWRHNDVLTTYAGRQVTPPEKKPDTLHKRRQNHDAGRFFLVGITTLFDMNFSIF